MAATTKKTGVSALLVLASQSQNAATTTRRRTPDQRVALTGMSGIGFRRLLGGFDLPHESADHGQVGEDAVDVLAHGVVAVVNVCRINVAERGDAVDVDRHVLDGSPGDGAPSSWCNAGKGVTVHHLRTLAVGALAAGRRAEAGAAARAEHAG